MNNSTPDERELELINNYTISPLDAKDIYKFAVVLCDNEIDRDCERFDIEALKKAAELFKGKTGIFDHSFSARDQSARIFDTEVVTDSERVTSAGEPYTFIKAYAYMPRTEKYARLIEEIETGMRKETSVGLAVKNKICSVCGDDIKHCGHSKGKFYDGRLCHAVLRDPYDAYEWSFVAVPAQKAAGVIKSYGGYRTVKKYASDGYAYGCEKSNAPFDTGGLLRLAAQGEEYRLSLVRESVKKCCLMFPEIESSFFEELLMGADVKKLLRLNAVAENSGKISALQLGAKESKQDSSNSEFRI